MKTGRKKFVVDMEVYAAFVHLVEVWLSAPTALHAPLDGPVMQDCTETRTWLPYPGSIPAHKKLRPLSPTMPMVHLYAAAPS